MMRAEALEGDGHATEICATGSPEKTQVPEESHALRDHVGVRERGTSDRRLVRPEPCWHPGDLRPLGRDAQKAPGKRSESGFKAAHYYRVRTAGSAKENEPCVRRYGSNQALRPESACEPWYWNAASSSVFSSGCASCCATLTARAAKSGRCLPRAQVLAFEIHAARFAGRFYSVA